jgi:NADH:ubiquinone oxidoreductase subunit F (NADH-binding)/(2Fe-2S) ferredoxin/Pyruvate/2-oxoacid:ferredoxin oxidoreductase delta subunit
VTFAERQARARDNWCRLNNGSGTVIWFGLATCGLAAGAGEVAEAVRSEIEQRKIAAHLIPVGCIGTCYLEPLMDIQKPGAPRISYGQMTADKARALIESYLVNGDPRLDLALGIIGDGQVDGVPRFFDLPMLKPQVRIATRNVGLINPEDIEHYLATGGYEGFQRALTMQPDAVIEEVSRSGLRGRGGAGFPTGQKWRFARQACGSPKYLICNADEGDPGAFMDRSVLEGDPHSVLEGMLIAAYAIGARQGYIYVRSEYPLAIQRLTVALAQMRDGRLLGADILGSGFDFDILIKEGAGAFVCGEETALIASLEGKRGMPNPRPPFPAESGLWGKPTNINNVETFANVPVILSRGADWFASFGTEKSKGTKTFSLAGKVKRGGLIEVPMGITLGEVIFDVGGGIIDDRGFKAVQTGGPSGGCLPARLAHLPIEYESLAQAGSIMGSGGLVVLDDRTCIVDIARYFLAFTQKESCGKCPPCRLGTKQMLAILEDFCAGKGSPEDLDLLAELAHVVKASSLCGLGQTAPNPVLSTLKYFRDEYEAHIIEKRCPAGVCKELIRYEILAELCKGCQACKRDCPRQCISGEKKAAHVIDQAACIKCGMCFEVCKLGAVEVV